MTNKEYELLREIEELNYIYATSDMSYTEYISHRKTIEHELKEIENVEV